MTYLVLFVAQFVRVSLRSFQQLNVFYDKSWWVFWTSGGMAAAEVGYYGPIVAETFNAYESGSVVPVLLLIVTIWISGALGSNLSMAVHKRVRNG